MHANLHSEFLQSVSTDNYSRSGKITGNVSDIRNNKNSDKGDVEKRHRLSQKRKLISFHNILEKI